MSDRLTIEPPGWALRDIIGHTVIEYCSQVMFCERLSDSARLRLAFRPVNNTSLLEGIALPYKDKKAVTAYYSSKQLLPFGFAGHSYHGPWAAPKSRAVHHSGNVNAELFEPYFHFREISLFIWVDWSSINLNVICIYVSVINDYRKRLQRTQWSDLSRSKPSKPMFILREF